MFDIDESKGEPKFDDLCRLCAKYDNVKISVFSDEGKRRELQKKIQSCLPFKVEENDGLPKSLCFKCVYNLENSYEFRDRCIEVNRNLEKQIQKQGSPGKRSTLSSNSRKIRPEVSIFAISPNQSDNNQDDEFTSISVDGEDAPNPFDYLKVDVNVDDPAPESHSSSRLKSNSSDSKKQYVWNANKRWLSVEHRPLNSEQKVESKVNTTLTEILHDDSFLNRRKNNNPRKIARDVEDEPQSTKSSSLSTSTSGLIAISTVGSSVSSSADSSSKDASNNTQDEDGADIPSTTTQSSVSSVIEDITKNKPEEQKTYSCLLCEKNFTQRSVLNKHFSITHGIEPYEVMSQPPIPSHLLTPYSADNKNDEEFAESMMEQETIIFCEVCRREFQDRASLWLHMVHAHREEASVSCGICLKICCDNITLIEHVNTAHSGDKAVIQRRYSCQVCGRQHDSRQKLLKHATLHTLIDNQGQTIQPEEMISLNNAFAPRECPICHKKFFSEEKLNLHTQNFHNDSHEASTTTSTTSGTTTTTTTTSSTSVVYKCELCSSSHANRMDRWWHVYHSHQGDDRVTCDHGGCRKIFVTQSLRDEHSKTHHETQGEFTNTCEICGKLWESRTVFYKHMMNVHPKCLPTICGVCMKIFSSVPELRAHVGSQHPPLDETNVIRCDVCARPYAERSKMLRHRRVHNVTDGVPATINVIKRKDDLICSMCPELPFERLEDIGDHRRSVHQLFVCDLCPKFYNGNNHLWKHVSKQHKGDPNVTCNLCLRTSASRAHLERHKIKYHSDPVDKLINRPSADATTQVHKCNLCGKIFRIRSLLKKHLKSCKGARPVVPKVQPVNGVFPCSKCSKVFEQQSVLSKHLKNSHVVHFCEACDEVEPKVGFDSKTALLDHIRAVHTNDPELVCDVEGCNKVLRLKVDLQKHKQEHLRGYFTYICDMCGDMFSNRKKLRKHLLTFHKSHVQHLCAVCVAILSSVNELVEHVHANHPVLLHRPFTCQICGKCYPSNCKVVDHIGNAHGKQYKPCRVCWKIFTDEQLLEEHVQNHPPAEEKPVSSTPARKDSRARSKASLAQELSALGISFELNENGKREAEEEPLNLEESGKRLRKKYKCTSCKDTFRSIDELKEHKVERHANSCVSVTEVYEVAEPVITNSVDAKNERWTDYRPIDCDCCGKTWNSKKQLWQHLIRSHPRQSMHTCGICLQVCKSYYDLWYHLDALHPFILNDPGGRFACYVCGHYHNSQSKLDKHIGVHKEPPLPTEFRCQYCQRLYRSTEYYREHVRMHETNVVSMQKKKESSDFGGFSIDSILSTTASAAAGDEVGEDDITEVDENDIEKMEDDDDLVELEEEDDDSDSDNGSNVSVKDLSCEDNVFRGYENDEYMEQLPHSSGHKISQLLAGELRKHSRERAVPTLNETKIEDESEVASPAEDVEVDLESDISYSSVENSSLHEDDEEEEEEEEEDDLVYNGKQIVNPRVEESIRYGNVNNNQKQERGARLDVKQNFRGSNGEEYFRRVTDI